MKQILAALAIIALAFSCKAPKQTKVVDYGAYNVEHTYGEAFTVSDVTSINELVVGLEKADTLDVIVEANIEAVCKKKGCWMNLVDTSNPIDDNAFFVKFKDYGFFVPVDAEGYKVLVKGKAYKEVTSVDELQHYAEDEGKSEEEIALITEPTEELKIMSTGVYKVK